MERVRSALRDTLGGWARNADWGLVITVAGFIACAAVESMARSGIPCSGLITAAASTARSYTVRGAAIVRKEPTTTMRARR
jgi:hypothetical protein